MKNEGSVLPDPQGERAAAVPELVLEEHPAAEQHVHVRVADGAERGHRLPVDRPGEAAARPPPPPPDACRLRPLGVRPRQLGRARPGRSSTRSRSRRSRSRAPSSIGLVLGAARAHRVPVVSQLTAVYVEVIRCTPILVQIFMIFFGLPAARHHVRPVHRRLAVGDALGRRVQQRELPRRLRRRLAAPP